MSDDIPGPSGREMLANLSLIRRSAPRFLAQCVARYGPVVRFPSTNAVLVADPLAIRQVLQSNHTAYGKQTIQYDTLALVTGSGLLVSEGDVWQRLRRVVAPAFHHGAVGPIQRRVVDLALDWAKKQRQAPGHSVDLDTEMLELSLRIVADTLLGGSISSPRVLVDAVSDALRVVVTRAKWPLPTRWPAPGGRRLRRSLAVLDAAVTDLIESRRRGAPGRDALWLLLTAQDAGVATASEVRDEVVTLIVAGHETVAASLTWTWLLLAAHPGVEQRLHAEVDRVADDDLTARDVLDRLPLTRAVTDESLRLFPPAWVLTRRSLRPDVLCGREIPTGSMVIMSPFVTHRDGRFWPDPARFVPERFSEPRGADLGHGGLRYFPFGAGPRLCVGRDLARLEIPLVVAAVARRLRPRPLHPGTVRMDFGVTLRPAGGLPAVISLRTVPDGCG